MGAVSQGFDYQKLDEVIHSRPRLGIMSVLVAVEEADFNFLKERLGMTDGNLSIHLRKLEEAGYISVKKGFLGRKPHTRYAITERGRHAFSAYLQQLEKLIQEIRD